MQPIQEPGDEPIEKPLDKLVDRPSSNSLNSQDWFKPAQSAAPAPINPSITSNSTQPYAETGMGAGGGSVVVLGASPLAQDNSQKRRRFPKPLRWVALALLVVLLSAGYVFGMYLPNKPENVFNTGLNRTGVAIDKLTAVGTEKTKLNDIKKVELSGGITVDGPSGKQTGTISSRYDQSKSDSTLSYKPDGSTKNFTVQALTDLASGQKYPDMYFKVTGLSLLGLDQYVPELVQYDGKWVNVSPAFLQSVIPSEPASDTAKQQSGLTPQDTAEITKAAVSTTRQYVFTDDQSKSVLKNLAYKNKETIEGNIPAYHYLVYVDNARAKDYCKALITNVMATGGFKHLPAAPTENLGQIKSDAVKNCDTNIDKNFKSTDTFDLWINAKNKLISKIRIKDPSDATSYVDLGQTYESGNIFPAFVYSYSAKDHYDAKLHITTDFDKNATKLDFSGNFGEGRDSWKVKATAGLKPYEKDVTVTKPIGSVPVETVLQSFGIDPASLKRNNSKTSNTGPINSGTPNKAKDTERLTDLKAIQGRLEVFYSQYSMYPKLDEINDPGWRSKYMKNLDAEALADPDGQIQKMLSSPSVKQYGYAPDQCDVFNGCQVYTLSAILSDGTTKTITNAH